MKYEIQKAYFKAGVPDVKFQQFSHFFINKKIAIKYKIKIFYTVEYHESTMGNKWNYEKN